VKPTFFPTTSDLHAWFEANHKICPEFSIGFYKVASGRPSVTYSEAVDEALCFGWIDGVRHRLDDNAYKIRFTPRRATSKWSAVNIRRVQSLMKLGRMQPAGLKAFEGARQQPRHYSYEQRNTAKLDPVHEKQFRANKKAWAFFQAQPPWYRRTTAWWIISAKKEETRRRRLARLVADSAGGQRIDEIPQQKPVPKRPRK
jgi:uncharacterized protein YdeI (YjbR/CyaY-like superfamily)